MNYIVDSCVWIDFFGQSKYLQTVSRLLTDNLAFTNNVILAELLPAARKNKEHEFIECLSGLEAVPLNIDWAEIEEIQLFCLKSGLNKLGLLDIVIAQNARQNNMGLFSTDRHMRLLGLKLGIKLKTQ
ncbi:MAG: PIN domain-containing protein [Candidatus Margulisbacteria bacterium]|jgi:predicted nucleic acid-binding protein|nr:PIN domain-containing protein [Candidatus Margulisiibacteriota bacterium]